MRLQKKKLVDKNSFAIHFWIIQQLALGNLSYLTIIKIFPTAFSLLLINNEIVYG